VLSQTATEQLNNAIFYIEENFEEWIDEEIKRESSFRKDQSGVILP